MSAVPAEPDQQGRYVLYWMIAQRRLRHNYALDRALERAQALGKPLLVFEALRADYEHASARIHAFVLQGMDDNEAEAARHGVRYLRYVEPSRGAAKGLLSALADHACVVVTDAHPVFHFPRMTNAAGKRIPKQLEAVDANGLLPFRSTDRPFATAYAFRRHLQKVLPEHLQARPSADPLRALEGAPKAVVPRAVTSGWPSATSIGGLPIDHAVAPTAVRGGSAAGRARLEAFLRGKLGRYAENRNDPDDDAASGLSPYLHFGHVGAHEIFDAIVRQEDWTVADCAPRADGKRKGWWGMSEGAEAFLDQLVTWRELGVNTCVHLPDDYATLGSLPEFAQRTLAEHASDERPIVYELAQLEGARTHDELWNAAQRQLLREGTIQNYLRMLWGKKILEWTRSPEEALETMIHLNDKYALDGRDPNSYSGILWCLGRHDRGWGPERPIFGTVRYMSSESARRKLKLGSYLERYARDASDGRRS